MEAALKEKKEQQIATKPNVAFIGMGWIGRDRFKALIEKELIACSGIYDPYLQNIENDDLLCEFRQVEDFKEVINDDSLDAIVIATPNMLHARQCQQALEAGKAVFVQKPLARTAKETSALIHSAKENNKLLGVDYSYRFTEGIQKIKSLVDADELGEIFAIETAFHNAYGPDKEWFYDMERSGGGCLLDLGCHLVDLSLYITDFPKADVKHSSRYYQGRLISAGEDQVEDFCSADLQTEDGIDISIGCSWNLSAGKEADIYFKIYGTKGAAIFENVDGSFYNFRSYHCRGTERELLTQPPESWGGKAIIDWASKLKQNNTFNEDAWQYLQSAQLIDKIYGR
ncbi:MAG: Gfo/Idh/MocA family protein [Candidatus Cyclobacteriaceae bacterium M2_1C_046]